MTFISTLGTFIDKFTGHVYRRILDRERNKSLKRGLAGPRSPCVPFSLAEKKREREEIRPAASS